MMYYVKQFHINGVDTRQVACIELHGKPNAATEGAVGVLGIDVDSPTRDVYKCVGVNGAIYTWMPFSSGGTASSLPPTSIDLSRLDPDDTGKGYIVETYPDGAVEETEFTYTDGKITKIKDSDGNETVLTW